MPRAGHHYNLGTSRGPDKTGSRAGPGPRAVSFTWLSYNISQFDSNHFIGDFLRTKLARKSTSQMCKFDKCQFDYNQLLFSPFLTV